MDPATAIQLVSAIGGIIHTIYAYGNAVKDARTEIAHLRGELFGLKAALEHIAWSIDGQFIGLTLADHVQDDLNQTSSGLESSITTEHDPGRRHLTPSLVGHQLEPHSRSPFITPILASAESMSALEEARQLLTALQKALAKPGSSRGIRLLQQVTWPLKRSETLMYTRHLEAVKSYFILATTSDNLQLSRDIYAEIRGLRHELEERQSDVERKSLRDATRQWLSECNPMSVLETVLADKLKGTGGWFVSDVFYEWLNDDVPTLWLRGKPGSGKTTLFSSCVEASEFSWPPLSMGYFFCSVNDPASQDLVNILGSLVLQLCEKCPSYWDIVEKSYVSAMAASKSSLKRAGVPELEHMLKEVTENLPHVCIFLDAPNECDDAESILESVLDIVHSRRNIRLMVSSTEEIQPTLVQHSLSSPRIIDIDGEGLQNDMGSYVDAHLTTESRLRSLSHDVKGELKENLVGRNDGSFRWVKCQIENLARSRSLREIRLAIQQVPPTLNDTYIAILASVSVTDQPLVRKMLLWTTFALRNLTLNEVAEAAVFDNSHTDSLVESRLLVPFDLLKCVRSLVRYDPETDLLALAHSSVRTFLTSETIKNSKVHTYYLDPRICRVEIACDCIDYLCMPAFQSGFCNNYDALVERIRAWPLANYATAYWTQHTGLGLKNSVDDTVPAPIQQSLDPFFATAYLSQGGCFSAWYELAFPEGNATLWLTKPLYFAAREGLVPIARSILASANGRAQIEVQGGRRLSSPLHVAATYGQRDMVDFLLSAGADPNEQNGYGESGLQWAHAYRHYGIVDALLKAGADPARIEGAKGIALSHPALDELDEFCLAKAYYAMEKLDKATGRKRKLVKKGHHMTVEDDSDDDWFASGANAVTAHATTLMDATGKNIRSYVTTDVPQDLQPGVHDEKLDDGPHELA